MQRMQAPILEINKPFEKILEIGKRIKEGRKSGALVLEVVAEAAKDTLVLQTGLIETSASFYRTL